MFNRAGLSPPTLCVDRRIIAEARAWREAARKVFKRNYREGRRCCLMPREGMRGIRRKR